MKDVHTRRDAHLASMHQVTKSEALFLNTFSSLGYFFLACPSTHYFLRAYFSLLKLWPFPKWRASRLPASCTASPTPTSPAESRLEFQMFFFPPASETNATSVSTRISEHEISFQYSVYQKGVDNVRKRLDVEGTQRKFNHCLLQLCDRSHLALTLTHTPEFCWEQQLLVSPSILVPLQILPRSSSYMWALAVLRVSTEGQNSLIRSCFPISFGQQWWIFQILQEILQ